MDESISALNLLRLEDAVSVEELMTVCDTNKHLVKVGNLFREQSKYFKIREFLSSLNLVVLSWRWDINKTNATTLNFAKDFHSVKINKFLRLARELKFQYAWVDYCTVPQFSDDKVELLKHIQASRVLYEDNSVMLVDLTEDVLKDGSLNMPSIDYMSRLWTTAEMSAMLMNDKVNCENFYLVNRWNLDVIFFLQRAFEFKSLTEYISHLGFFQKKESFNKFSNIMDFFKEDQQDNNNTVGFLNSMFSEPTLESFLSSYFQSYFRTDRDYNSSPPFSLSEQEAILKSFENERKTNGGSPRTEVVDSFLANVVKKETNIPKTFHLFKFYDVLLIFAYCIVRYSPYLKRKKFNSHCYVEILRSLRELPENIKQTSFNNEGGIETLKFTNPGDDLKVKNMLLNENDVVKLPVVLPESLLGPPLNVPAFHDLQLRYNSIKNRHITKIIGELIEVQENLTQITFSLRFIPAKKQHYLILGFYNEKSSVKLATFLEEEAESRVEIEISFGVGYGKSKNRNKYVLNEREIYFKCVGTLSTGRDTTIRIDEFEAVRNNFKYEKIVLIPQILMEFAKEHRGRKEYDVNNFRSVLESGLSMTWTGMGKFLESLDAKERKEAIMLERKNALSVKQEKERKEAEELEKNVRFLSENKKESFFQDLKIGFLQEKDLKKKTEKVMTLVTSVDDYTVNDIFREVKKDQFATKQKYLEEQKRADEYRQLSLGGKVLKEAVWQVTHPYFAPSIIISGAVAVAGAAVGLGLGAALSPLWLPYATAEVVKRVNEYTMRKPVFDFKRNVGAAERKILKTKTKLNKIVEATYEDEELGNLKVDMFNYIIEYITLIIGMVYSGGDFIKNSNAEEKFFSAFGHDDFPFIDVSNARNIVDVFNDSTFQIYYGRARDENSKLRPLAYFVNKLHQTTNTSYVLTEEDVDILPRFIHAVRQLNIHVDGVDFTYIDISCQKNELRKWIHVFDDVTMVCLIVTLTDYSVVDAASGESKLKRALEYFAQLSSNKAFIKTSFTLILNTFELVDCLKKKAVSNIEFSQFKEKMMEEKLLDDNNWDLLNFTDSNKLEKAVFEYFKDLFLIRYEGSGEVYHHSVSIDFTPQRTGIGATLFNALKDIILKSHLRDSGFMEKL